MLVEDNAHWWYKSCYEFYKLDSEKIISVVKCVQMWITENCRDNQRKEVKSRQQVTRNHFHIVKLHIWLLYLGIFSSSTTLKQTSIPLQIYILTGLSSSCLDISEVLIIVLLILFAAQNVSHGLESIFFPIFCEIKIINIGFLVCALHFYPFPTAFLI